MSAMGNWSYPNIDPDKGTSSKDITGRNLLVPRIDDSGKMQG